MTKNRTSISKFDWYYTRWGGIMAVCLIKFWARIFRSPAYTVELNRPIDPHEATIIVSNHQTLLDPPAVFSALKYRDLLHFSPVKFMTWHKYYNSVFKLPLYTTGCYPSHGDGLTGVKGAVYFAQHNYRSFIFPEGKRTRPGNRGKAYPGISEILNELPDARLILVHLDWQNRNKLLSRPDLLVHFSDAPKDLNLNSPEAIMDAIYNLK